MIFMRRLLGNLPHPVCGGQTRGAEDMAGSSETPWFSLEESRPFKDHCHTGPALPMDELEGQRRRTNYY